MNCQTALSCDLSVYRYRMWMKLNQTSKLQHLQNGWRLTTDQSILWKMGQTDILWLSIKTTKVEENNTLNLEIKFKDAKRVNF